MKGEFKFGRPYQKEEIEKEPPIIQYRGPHLNNVIIEPSRTNRFLINLSGTEIPNYLFRKYNLFYDEGNFYLELEFYETVNFIFDVNNFFNIREVNIQYLDPTGVSFGFMNLEVLDYIEFEKIGDYSLDTLTTNSLTLKVRPL